MLASREGMRAESKGLVRPPQPLLNLTRPVRERADQELGGSTCNVPRGPCLLQQASKRGSCWQANPKAPCVFAWAAQQNVGLRLDDKRRQRSPCRSSVPVPNSAVEAAPLAIFSTGLGSKQAIGNVLWKRAPPLAQPPMPVHASSTVQAQKETSHESSRSGGVAFVNNCPNPFPLRGSRIRHNVRSRIRSISVAL